MAHTAANSTAKNPITIEVFNADITISDKPITVKAITFVSAAAGDDFALKTVDSNENTGHICIHLAQNINGGMVSVDFGDKGITFPNLFFDASEVNAGLGAGDRVEIYLV